MLSTSNDILTVVFRQLHCKKRQGLTSTYSLSVDSYYFTGKRSFQKPVPSNVYFTVYYKHLYAFCINEND